MGKNGFQNQKCTLKINFKRTNHILEDDIIPLVDSQLLELKIPICHVLNGERQLLINLGSVTSKVIIMKKILINYF